jgi:hypothetical protein
MRVLIDHVLPHFPRHVFIQWSVEDATAAELAGLTFEVQRSGSPKHEGNEWETVATGVSTVMYGDTLFEDNDGGINNLSLDREIWYRVVAVTTGAVRYTSNAVDNEGSTPGRVINEGAHGLTVDSDETRPTPDTVFHDNPRIQRRLQLVHRAVQRYAHIALEMFTGVRIGVLKKRHFGVRCTVCFDKVLKQSLVSNCRNCYGTGWEGGYFPAVGTLMRITEGDTQTQIEPEGETKLTRARAEFVDYPRLEKGDVIVELFSNRRWQVDGTSERKLRRNRVTQHMQVMELARTSVEYRVAVPADLQSPLYEYLGEFSSAFSSAFRHPL